MNTTIQIIAAIEKRIELHLDMIENIKKIDKHPFISMEVAEFNRMMTAAWTARITEARAIIELLKS